jgi:hypothetical protein
VSHPRIAVFARLANGNTTPLRSIEGQGTKLARTMHAIAYDYVHDEIVVTNPFAEAVLFFRAEATGEEPPIRVIQGPRTHLTYPGGPLDAVALDAVHGEVYVPLRQTGAILVFPRTANGDVAPVRILRGPKTQLAPERVAVDPVNNLLLVGNLNPPAILVFNRTDQGDVSPRTVIAGPKTGIIRPQAIAANPEQRVVVVAVTDRFGIRDYQPGFVGVWNYSDQGDVAPKLIIKGPSSELIRPRGVALNARNKELYVVDMDRNALLTFFTPELF